MEEYSKLDKRLALLEQKIDILQNNHLAHMAEDIKQLQNLFKWGVGVLFVQLLGVIAMLMIQ